MRKAILTIAAAAALAIPAAAVTGSAKAGDNYCGPSANGCEHSQANTPCAGHGGFGAFGKDNNFAGGASGDRTAFNNSTLCGNPQGRAGTLVDQGGA